MNADKSKVMVFEEVEGSVCKIHVDGKQLEHV